MPSKTTILLVVGAFAVWYFCFRKPSAATSNTSAPSMGGRLGTRMLGPPTRTT